MSLLAFSHFPGMQRLPVPYMATEFSCALPHPRGIPSDIYGGHFQWGIFGSVSLLDALNWACTYGSLPALFRYILYLEGLLSPTHRLSCFSSQKSSSYQFLVSPDLYDHFMRCAFPSSFNLQSNTVRGCRQGRQDPVTCSSSPVICRESQVHRESSQNSESSTGIG